MEEEKGWIGDPAFFEPLDRWRRRSGIPPRDSCPM